ncbi:RNA-binding (RRM/RBD/RNP motifs) family protein [Actinidia rufa]|uniref:RNA-binding (RRM/RBD/RNP motifs) family protein n=1 Tax=Actinidia rufa TaxID=165716 RepID=A0A7J0F8B8_9ERIC|nr:RNA-binding (RRM/RBD/RNP motifs) family protein [Actinidia rufa]
MDIYEATRIVLSRIQSIDQENASRIMGILLIKDHGEKEMIRLAFGPESLVHSVVLKARKELGLAPNSPPSPVNHHHHPISLSSFFSQISPNSSLSSFPTLSSISPNFSSALPFNGGRGADLADEFHLQDQLSFLDDGTAAAAHRRSFSVSDLCLGSDDPAFGFGWRPCLYYARGYCKNGNSCRFLHGGPTDSSAVGGGSPEIVSPHQQRLSSPLPYSALTENKCINLLLQQQQSETHRALMMGEDMNKFGQSRFGRSDLLANPSSRQIYLTFPADSTFREEDVSNYFSIYGPVQDVRIPYQQKRMFGFVTFVYAETVRMILAKGNPHFVCDARVLVKPYKEKGKVPDKYRKQLPMDRGEFSVCGSPTDLDSRDPCDLQLGGARTFCNTQDMLWGRKLEEQADLQQAIELQNRRLTSLPLLDVKRHNHHRALYTGATVPSPTHSPSFFNQSLVPPFDHAVPEVIEENGSNPARAVHATAVADQVLEPTVNVTEKEKELSTVNCTDENGNGKESSGQHEESDLPESLEDSLPDSPFASPKAAGDYTTTFNTASEAEEIAMALPTSSANNNVLTPSLIPPTSSLDMASFKSCYFQVPRFSSGHGAIEM